MDLARGLVAEWITKAIDEKWGTAVAAERATGISQTEFSRIRNGNLERYTIDRLVRLLKALDRQVEVRLKLKVRRRKAS